MINFLDYRKNRRIRSILQFLGNSIIPPDSYTTVSIYCVCPGVYKGKPIAVRRGRGRRLQMSKVDTIYKLIFHSSGLAYPEIFFLSREGIENFIIRYGYIEDSDFEEAKAAGDAYEFSDTKFRLFP